MRVLKVFLPGLGVAIALLLFAYALGLVRLGSSEQGVSTGPSRTPLRVADRTERDLKAELSRAQAKIRILEQELSRSGQSAAPATQVGTGRAERPSLPANILAAGKVVGASEAALQAAYRLEMSLRNRRPDPGALDAFVAEGSDGFRALVALMRSGLRATWQKDWLRKTYQPGLEQVLIDFAEDPKHDGEAGIALTCLSIADTQRVRDYLVTRVQEDQTPDLVYSAAEALGDLKEPRGAAAIGLVFAQPGWGGVRGKILYNLGRMGGVHARRILIDYMRMENADLLASAVTALSKIDAAAAKLEATRLLARDGADLMDWRDRQALKKIAKQD